VADPTKAALEAPNGRRISSLVRRPSGRSRFESAIKAVLFAAAVVSILTTLGIVFSLLRETIAFFGDVAIADYLFGTKWTPQFAGDQQSFGVLPLIWGTLYLTGIGLLVAIPVGILSGIYLSEFAPRRVAKVVKPVLELLAGVPTIVFGYFALTFFTPEVLRNALGLGVNQFNALSAGIILGVLVVPTIATLVEDSMAAVPQSLREGSAGLGANRVQTALRVVFPAALSGIVAALVLGASRAIGETVIILIAGGQTANLSLNPTESYQSMAAFIAATARGDIPTGSIEYETIFVVGMTLFVFTLLLNMISIRLVRRYRQVYE
jgi:phosphate transport system permease protein